MGGGPKTASPMIEAISKIEQLTGKKLDWTYVDENRKGDHICYISDLRKFQFPLSWVDAHQISGHHLEEIVARHSRATLSAPSS